MVNRYVGPSIAYIITSNAKNNFFVASDQHIELPKLLSCSATLLNCYLSINKLSIFRYESTQA
jgi:hypothetical protein